MSVDHILLSASGAATVSGWVAVPKDTSSVQLNSIVSDSANNIYIVGRTLGTTGTLLKYDSKGSLLWQKGLTGVWSADVALDSYGNIYIATYVSSVGTLVKYDSSGNIVWEKSFAIANVSTTIEAISISPTNEIYIAGNFAPQSTAISYIALIKLDTTGNIIWQRKLDDSKGTRVNTLTCTNNYVVLGGYYTPSYLSGINYGLVMKFDSSGSLVFGSQFYVTSEHVMCQDVAVDSYDNVYATLDAGGGNYVGVVKFDTTGSFQWQMTFASLSSFAKLKVSNNVYITCGYRDASSSSGVVVMSISFSGVINWSKVFNSTTTSEYPTDITITPDTNLTIVCFSSNPSTRGLILSTPANGFVLGSGTYTIDGNIFTYTDQFISTGQRMTRGGGSPAISNLYVNNAIAITNGSYYTYGLNLTPISSNFLISYYLYNYWYFGVATVSSTQINSTWCLRMSSSSAGNGPAGIIKSDPNGNIYTLCTIQNASTGGYVNMIKYNNVGTQLWSITYGEGNYPGYQAIGAAINLAEDVYIIGYKSFGNTTSVRKYNSSGTKQWGYLGTTATGWVQYTAIQMDTSGYPVIVGTCYKGGTDYSIIVTSYDSSGSRRFFVNLGTSGGNYQTPSMVLDSSNNIIVTGRSGNLTYVAKLNSTGSVIWSKTITLSTAGGGYSYPQKITVSDSGDIYIAGNLYLSNQNGYYGIMLMKLTTAGTIVWLQGTTDSSYNGSISDISYSNNKLYLSLNVTFYANSTSFAVIDANTPSPGFTLYDTFKLVNLTYSVSDTSLTSLTPPTLTEISDTFAATITVPIIGSTTLTLNFTYYGIPATAGSISSTTTALTNTKYTL